MNIKRGIDTIENIVEIPNKSVDLILTDPPYNFTDDLKLYLHEEFMRIAKSAVIVFSPPENQWNFGQLYEPDHYLFWTKAISTKNTSKSYSRFVEMIFVYELEDYVWNTQYHWSNYVNILNDKVVGLSDHPHEKPPSLIDRLIRLHSNPGQKIFDPFCGSGTIPKRASILKRDSIGWDKK